MIESETYKEIADKLGEMSVLGTEAIAHLATIPEIISNTTLPTYRAGDGSRIVLSASIATARLASRHVTISPQLRGLVVGLQQHVESHMGSVDDFLDAEGVQVTGDFANLSAECGYPISSANIRLA